MHRKSVFFGVGCGILIMVAISFVTYIVQRAAHINENTRLMAMIQENEATPVANPVDYGYIIDRARDMGMVFRDEIEPETIVQFVELDEPGEPAYNNDTIYTEPDEPYDETTEPDAQPVATPTLPAASEPFYTQTHVGMFIRSGLTASQAATYFENMGLVESAYEFSQYLIDNGYAHSIRAGHHIVPRGASFQDIVNIIVHGRNH